MDVTDLFPLTPFYPVSESSLDRRVVRKMESGKWYIRSKGSDLMVLDLVGRCSAADRKTLLDFYETHKTIGCTFSDADYSPAEDHVVQFDGKPTIERSGYEDFVWRVTLVETTTS